MMTILKYFKTLNFPNLQQNLSLMRRMSENLVIAKAREDAVSFFALF